jgi:hypothetical protein
MLEILNLDKREVISIDQLSDQNITEVSIVLSEILISLPFSHSLLVKKELETHQLISKI